MIRLLVAAGMAFALTEQAFAQNADEATAALLACESVKSEKARLECFEKALPALRGAHPGAAAIEHDHVETLREAESEKAEEEFGLQEAHEKKFEDEDDASFGEEDLRRQEDGKVKRMNGVAVKVGRNNAKKLYVILENGQIWKQVFDDGSTPYFKGDGAGLPIVITRGVLGGYLVRIGDSKDAFRAQRIK